MRATKFPEPSGLPATNPGSCHSRRAQQSRTRTWLISTKSILSRWPASRSPMTAGFALTWRSPAGSAKPIIGQVVCAALPQGASLTWGSKPASAFNWAVLFSTSHQTRVCRISQSAGRPAMFKSALTFFYIAAGIARRLPLFRPASIERDIERTLCLVQNCRKKREKAAARRAISAT